MDEKIERAYKSLKREMGDAIGDPVTALDGIFTFFVKRADIVNALTFLKKNADGAFDMLTDLTAVDWMKTSAKVYGDSPYVFSTFYQIGFKPMPPKSYRFEMVYHLCSTTANHRMRLKVEVNEAEPSVPTVTGIYMAANWMEREVWDMFGISFDGHPDLRRILLWEGFEGYPLRKDFPLRGLHPVERTPHT